MTQPDYLQRNKAAWQKFAADFVEPGEQSWAGGPHWGIWQIPETDVNILPKDLSGKRCIELGCGAAYVSAWLARRGGKVIGIDPTPNQLSTAQRMQRHHNLHFPLIEGIAEVLPFPDESFDFAISEYGAALWADPYAWIPEAARVLKPGAQLIFMTNASFAILCTPDEDPEASEISSRLLRPYLGMHRIEWDESSNEIEFHLPHGKWVELLTENGFMIERLLELGAPPDAASRYSWVNAKWAQSWPTEDVWVVRKKAD
ncbi:MAG: class I SAM-dependent methyltransferase [Pseudomonadota bacterium]